MAEVFEYELRGKDTSFGSTVKNAVKVVGELKSAGAQVLASFTGGLLGGGIAQSVLSAVSLVRDVIRESNELLNRADKLDIKARVLKQLERTEQTLSIGRGTIATAIETGRQSRSDALAGAPEANRAFSRLGLSPKDLEGLSPDELFAAIGKAFNAAGATRENRFALSQLIGGQGENALAPYLAGGMDFSQAKNAPTGTGFMVDRLYAAMNKGRFKADLEPLSTFGLDNEEKARRLNEAAAEQEARNARALLTNDQKRLAIAEQRLKLQRAMESEPDQVRKARMRGDIAQLVAEANSLAAVDIKAGMKPISRDMDQIARAGFFRGGAPDIATDTMRKQLAEMQRIAALLKTLPPEIARQL